MDPKASAKSKRTHSQHGRRNHPPPAAIAQKKKLLQAGEEEKARRAHPNTLPSNWDRYDDNHDEEGSKNPVGAKQADGEITPQSKGADFSYLIEEARSQPQEFHATSSESSSFVEFPFEFMQGGSSMLSVRGKNLLSWCGDDNFIVDDDRTSSYEVPFLSMDLHALAAQLSKLKLSQRLFIEADLLPEEQCPDESRTCTDEQSDFRHESELPAFKCHVDSGNSDDIQNNINSSSVLTGEVARTISTSHTAKPLAPSDSKPLEQFDSGEAQDSMEGTSIHTNPDSKSNKASRSVAVAVEEELDMLLDSFGQSLVSGAPMDGSVAVAGLLSTSRDPDSSRYSASASLDGAIDDLLAETSSLIKDQKLTVFNQKQVVSSPSLPPRVAPLGSGSGPMSARSSSRPAAMAAALDESIDDLLAETSVCVGGWKPTAGPQKGAAMDDLDSWLDTV